MIKRTRRVLKEKAREIFEGGKFNLELFQYVIDEYFRKKDEKKAKEEPAAEGEEAGESQTGLFSRVLGAKNGNLPWILSGLAVLLLVWASAYLLAPQGLFAL
jgi:hypothetical protein